MVMMISKEICYFFSLQMIVFLPVPHTVVSSACSWSVRMNVRPDRIPSECPPGLAVLLPNVGQYLQTPSQKLSARIPVKAVPDLDLNVVR